MHINFSPDSESADQIEFSDFMKVDIRVGKIVGVWEFDRARNPSYKLQIDFGKVLGLKNSSAQITSYSKEELLGKQVFAVVNFPARNIAGFMSEVLVLGVSDANENIKLPLIEGEIPKGSRLV